MFLNSPTIMLLLNSVYLSSFAVVFFCSLDSLQSWRVEKKPRGWFYPTHLFKWRYLQGGKKKIKKGEQLRF